MSLLEEMLKNSTVENTKGGKYYYTTYNSNLDMFSMLSRSMAEDKVLNIFKSAYAEDKKLSVANLLYLLDIREGKGERRLFKICFNWLCKNDKEYAIKVLNLIGELGRYDYILEALHTPIEKEVIDLIDKQLKDDYNSEYPSLLAKWLPSRGQNRKYLTVKLNLTNKQYRKILSKIRARLKLIETSLCNKEYSEIDFEKVPTKAMLKYRKAFQRHCEDEYSEYLDKASNGEKKINTKGLFAYEIVSKIYGKHVNKNEENLYQAMWEQQKDVLNGYDGNILVMADTSGSMTWGGSGNAQPIYSSIGLALYIAERNKGAFKDYYMTFSSRPLLQKVTGKTIVDKVHNVKSIVQDTDIDRAFELLLETAKNSNIPEEEMPTHIIIISDMEFDNGVYSKDGTNFNGWKKAFEENGYKLPKIVFWNVSGDVMGTPTTKFENDVAMINGFSTSVFENILNIENLTPENVMLTKLEKYLNMIQKR